MHLPTQANLYLIINYLHNSLDRQNNRVVIFGFGLYNTIHLLCHEVACKAEGYQTSRDRPKPRQIAFNVLAWDPHVHSPHTSDDIHGQNDGTDDRKFAENVGGLLCAFVHADVDLSQVIAVSAGEQAA